MIVRRMQINRPQQGQQRQQKTSFCNTLTTTTTSTTASDWELRNRRIIRDPQLLEAVKNLDMTADPAYRQQLIDWIRTAYEERCGGQLMAIFSKCHLGHPYLDHQMSIVGKIVEHYTFDQDIPAIFHQARGLAAHPGYAYIEIYSDGEIIPVSNDGTAR